MQPTVDHRVLAIDVHERAMAQPIDERVAIARGEHVVERVALLLRRDARDACEQVQVVVAEHGDHRVALRDRPAQHVERRGAAIDEIADEPELIARRRVAEVVEQPIEARLAALNVADRVTRQGQTSTRAVMKPARALPTRTSSTPAPRTMYVAQPAFVVPRVPGYAGRFALVCSPRPQPSRWPRV